MSMYAEDLLLQSKPCTLLACRPHRSASCSVLKSCSEIWGNLLPELMNELAAIIEVLLRCSPPQNAGLCTQHSGSLANLITFLRALQSHGLVCVYVCVSVWEQRERMTEVNLQVYIFRRCVCVSLWRQLFLWMQWKTPHSSNKHSQRLSDWYVPSDGDSL